ncbi:MAG: transporter substrate-binding domain-containing protein [Candidatus Syntrophopropionicum ammoniitolerans]
MKRLVPIIFILIAAVLIVSGCGKKETNELVVGMELAYPPFETKDEYGNPTGVSVDLAGAFGEFADRAVKIENISWDGLIPALQAGKVDAVISSMTITEERKKKLIFPSRTPSPYWHY